jgi:hypothetical protein
MTLAGSELNLARLVSWAFLNHYAMTNNSRKQYDQRNLVQFLSQASNLLHDRFSSVEQDSD